MVGPERVERSTSRLSGVRSNHLSYEPDRVDPEGLIAPKTRQHPRYGSRARRKRKGNEGGGKSPLCLKRMSRQSRERRAVALKSKTSILRKEVIQPQVPLRLPCYDFTPVAD